MPAVLGPTPTHIVYGLRVLGSHDYRYIGITTKGLDARLRSHRAISRRGKYPVNRWFRRHPYNIVADVLFVSEEQSVDELNQMERVLVAGLREAGAKLLNITDGGDGAVGRRQSESAKRQISESLRGVPHTAERRLRQREAALRRAPASDAGRLARSKSVHAREHQVEVRLICVWCRAQEEQRIGRSLTPAEVETGTLRDRWTAARRKHNARCDSWPRVTCYFCTPTTPELSTA